MPGDELVKSQDDSVKNESIDLSQEASLDSLPKEVAAIIEDLPPDVGKKVKSSLLMSMSSFHGIVPGTSPVIEKLNAEHITKILESSNESDKREFNFAIWEKVFNLVFVIIAIGVFVFLTIYLSKNNTTVYLDIIKIMFGFLGGFGVGKAYKSIKK